MEGVLICQMELESMLILPWLLDLLSDALHAGFPPPKRVSVRGIAVKQGRRCLGVLEEHRVTRILIDGHDVGWLLVKDRAVGG